MGLPLFFFGTLQHPSLLEAVMGNADHLQLTPARLPGYRVRAVTEGPFPGIEAAGDDFAPGVLVNGLRNEDIARLDYYESAFEYTLREERLEDGQAALVYFPAPGEWTLAGPWSLTEWARDWGELSVRSALEVMEYFGRKSPEDVGRIFPMIRARAWSEMNAGKSRHGAGTLPGKITFHERSRPYASYFALDACVLQHERFDGAMTPPLSRVVFRAPDAALVLPYDPVRDRVLLVEQMRMGPLARGDRAVWQLEPVAGRLDPGEAPEAAARREAMEEAGLEISQMFPVAEAYCSPGNSSEFFYIYVGFTDLPDGVAGLGGLETENEDIRSHLMSFEALMRMCDAQEAANSPLVLAAYWLARHRERLQALCAT